MTKPSIKPFARAHLDGLVALVAAEGWSEYTVDVERTYRALSARKSMIPGTSAITQTTDTGGNTACRSGCSTPRGDAHPATPKG